MADTEPARVEGQDNAYRRGLVLGLTMAETMLLILFMLLLVLGAILANREAQIRKRDEHIAQLSAVQHFLDTQFPKGKSGVTVADIIQRIERQQRRNDELQQQVALMKPYEATGKALQDIVHEIKREGGQVTPQEIAKRISDAGKLTKDNSTLKGQVAQLTHQIKASGRGGNEFPSCWVTADGKTQSIFELTLTGSGVKIDDRHLPDRIDDEARLPVTQVQFNSELAPSDFLAQLHPLYEWSVAHSCRFYVIIYSTVGSTPIQAVNAANDYFYPDSRIQYRPVLP